MTSDILRDIVVVELASVLAGPAVGMFFAELGAEVIKIENKRSGGDVTRQWKLPSEDPDDPESAYYKSANWGKQVMMLDLTADGDRKILVPLLERADIVVCNFKHGSAARLQLDYESVRKINSGIIYANLTAFGKYGDRPGYDVLMQAETGYLSMTGESGRPPSKLPVALIDILAAHQLKEALLIALYKRAGSGTGAEISVNLAQSSVASLANQASGFLNTGVVPQQMGSLHPNICPYGEIFRTSDAVDIILAVGNDDQFRMLCRIMGNETLADEQRFANNSERVRNRHELQGALAELFSNSVADDVLKEFEIEGVPAGRIKDLESVFTEDYARDMILNYEDGSACVRTSAFEINFSNPA